MRTPCTARGGFPDRGREARYADVGSTLRERAASWQLPENAVAIPYGPVYPSMLTCRLRFKEV